MHTLQPCFDDDPPALSRMEARVELDSYIYIHGKYICFQGGAFAKFYFANARSRGVRKMEVFSRTRANSRERTRKARSDTNLPAGRDFRLVINPGGTARNL